MSKFLKTFILTILLASLFTGISFGQSTTVQSFKAPLSVTLGGSGAATLTDHSVLVGSGTSAVTPIAVGDTGEVLIGNTGADPLWSGSPTLTTVKLTGLTDNYFPKHTSDAVGLEDSTLQFDANSNLYIASDGIRIAGTIGSLTGVARTDAGLEIGSATTSIMSLMYGPNPGNTTYEGAHTFSAYDSAGAIKKTASISSMWADATAGTGNGVLRLNATYGGGNSDDVALRIFGNYGVDLFGTSDTSGPGLKIVRVKGKIDTYYAGNLLSGNFYYTNRFLNANGTKGLNFGYDNAEVLGIISSQDASSGIAFWTHNGSNWGERARFSTSGGSFLLGDTANAKSTLGLTINQGANDNEILSLKSSDVSHSFTDITEANTFMSICKFTAANGGVFLRAFNDTNDSGLRLDGYIGVANPTDTTPAIIMAGGKLSSNTVGALADAETVFQLRNWSTNLLTVLGNGYTGIGTTGPNMPLHVYSTIANDLVLLQSTVVDGSAYLAFQNDARTWRIAVRGDVSDSFVIRDSTATADRLTIDSSGNFGLGATSFGTSAAKVLGIASGTAPTTSPADAAQMWVTDHNAQAGYARLHQRPENVTYTPASPLALLSEVEMMSNPKAMSQGVNMTYADSGSSGIMVADNDNIDFGTGSFTLVWRGTIPDYVASVQSFLFYKYDSGVGYALSIDEITGKLSAALNATRWKTADAPPMLVDGTAHTIAAVITVGEVNTTVDFYIDGFMYGSQVSEANAGTVSNAGTLYCSGLSNVRTASTIHFAAIFNRALTAAEVLDLYRNGIAYADKWGSQTSIITGNDSTFAGASNWANVDINAYDETGDLTITASAAGQYCTLPVANATTVAGKRYRLVYDIANLVSTWTIKDFGGTQTIDTIDANGTGQNIEFTASTTGGLRIVAVANNSSADIDNVYLYEIGATLALEPEGIQPAPGQWLDSSTNKLHAWQPATGSSLTRYKNTFEIRGVNTWAGTHEAQSVAWATDASKPILPVNCYIDEIIGVITGTTIADIIIGDGSDTDRWVEATTGLAAGTTSFTLANRISDGTNYEMVVDPDDNFTGSIRWTIRGHILD